MFRFSRLLQHIIETLSAKDGEIKQSPPYRHVKGQRLVFYNEFADVGFWERQWEEMVSLATYTEALNGKLGAYEKLFNEYLPKKGRILDAGCGLGKLVLALRARGYDCEGVDWASKTIKEVKELFPSLPLWVGDVTHLDVPNGFFSAYISLGVIEHILEGPEPFLQEARRILAPGGIALIAVPHFHALRRFKARIGLYHMPHANHVFYQYAFTPQDFLAIVNAQGFEVLRTFRYGVGWGLTKELPLINQLLKLRFIGGILWRCFEQLPLAEHYFGHNLLVVARLRGS